MSVNYETKVDITTNDIERLSYFDLGLIPLVNNLNETEEESLKCEKYPLSISLFEKSGLTRLDYIVPSKVLFDNYLYTSGVNKPFYNHCSDMFVFLNKYLDLTDEDLIVDIGGNDGTLLRAFKERAGLDLQVLNIEPSSVFKLSESNGIKTINKYFSREVVEEVNKKAKLVITTNVFQHLYDIKSFGENVRELLDDHGIWCIEFPYWFHTMETLQFDQIYHEHIYYYTFKSIKKFLNSIGLKVFHVVKQSIHSGSLRVLVTKSENKFEIEDSVQIIMTEEKKIDLKYYKDWNEKVLKHKSVCKEILFTLCSKYNVVGFGASAKGCVFLNFLNIKNDTLKFIIDDTPLKKNKYVPGTGIKIVDRVLLKKEKVDYVLILAHNFHEYIIKSLREYGYQGKFIILLPEIKIL